MATLTRRLEESEISPELLESIRGQANRLVESHDLDPLIERIGEARYVLIGEASHGTADFYRWRAELSRRLILEKDFNFIGVEGDWPDCYRVHEFVTGRDTGAATAEEALHTFARWPTWMWANAEVAEFIDWLRRQNDRLPLGRKVGFFGLDVYSLWDSLYAIVGYLQRSDPTLLPAAWRAMRCFEPYAEDVQQYAAALRFVPLSCEQEVVELLDAIRQKSLSGRDDNPDAAFVAEQNAHVLKNAEAYYRAMIRGGPESWNIRDRHMTETLDRLASHYGPAA